MALAYFSLMELLQAYTYTVIDQCFNPNNQIATFLGYMHIAFQPFFVNAVTMHFIPQPLWRRIAPYVYGLCFAAATIFMMRIYPFDWASLCFERFYQFLPGTDIKFSMPFCGRQICSTSGQWHIAWAIPASGSIAMANSYVYAAFVLPLLYGSWKLVLPPQYRALIGLLWCLYSIGLLLLLIKPPVRRFLHVTSWYGQTYPKFLTRERLERNAKPK